MPDLKPFTNHKLSFTRLYCLY